MLDGYAPPDLSLLIGPRDRAEFVAFGDWRRRCGRREPCLLYVIHHAASDWAGSDWTSACRLVRDGRPGHLSLFVEATRDGDARAELRAWLEHALAGMAER